MVLLLLVSVFFLCCFVFLCAYFLVMGTRSQVLKMSFKSGKGNCASPLLSASKDLGVGDLFTHLFQPCLTCSLRFTLRDLGFLGVTFSKRDVSQGAKLSLQDEQENPGSGRAGLPQHPSLAVVKVFTLPSPGPLGQTWCSSYRPDKAVKQTAKKTQPSLYSPCVQQR